MRKVILMMLLAVMSSSAMAEWVKLYDKGNYTIYIDPATIRKTDNIAKMWYLADLHQADTTADGKAYMSRKTQDEYDCKEEQSRTMYLSAHSGNMGRGETVFVVNGSYIDGKWIPIPPNSVAKDMWNLACGKR